MLCQVYNYCKYWPLKIIILSHRLEGSCNDWEPVPLQDPFKEEKKQKTLFILQSTSKIMSGKESKIYLFFSKLFQNNLKCYIFVFQLFLMPEYQASRRVCLYLSMAEEVNTYHIMNHALQNKKECFIPQYIGKNRVNILG